MKNVNRMTSVMVGCVVVVSASGLFAQDWPQWRGPNRDGKVTGFSAPQTWPTNLTQRWQVPVGKGDTTSALVGDKLYTFGRLDADEVVLCLNAASGKTIWETKYP